MEGLELDAFFRHHRIARAQHRLHNTSWYKDINKLEDIVIGKKDVYVSLTEFIFLSEKTYRLNCWGNNQRGIPIVTVKA
ncbi:hypothetical protein Glove_209g116 [Diversispora epigaea]|uniref:Uncharacterized protein n=1 Tax=Diversispora epigaea TaxID=1348612 RepID=A0A397ISV0_9GLOM|nr:hypothetical protein Glove_209g116 [Diversispora epigaea]